MRTTPTAPRKERGTPSDDMLLWRKVSRNLSLKK